MENLFIRQCSALIETMLFCKREQQNRELIMVGWVEENKCGYAACVLGHHATMNDAAPFQKNDLISLFTTANLFAKQLENACKEVFVNNYLAKSIYGPFYNSRCSHAWETNLFTDEELENLNHLNKEPSYDDVIEYLELVIHKTEQALEQAA